MKSNKDRKNSTVLNSLTFLNTRWRYLALLPMITVVLVSMWNVQSVKDVERSVIDQQFLEVVNKLEVIVAAVDANPERNWEDHEANIIGSVQYMDRLDHTFSVAYKYTDNKLQLITERSNNMEFDFTTQSQLLKLIETQEVNSMIISLEPDGGLKSPLRVYYRWIPSYSQNRYERYLIVVGISEGHIRSTLSTPLINSAGQWILIGLLTVLSGVLVVLVAMLGYIYDARAGSGDDKFRSQVVNSVSRVDSDAISPD